MIRFDVDAYFKAIRDPRREVVLHGWLDEQIPHWRDRRITALDFDVEGPPFVVSCFDLDRRDTVQHSMLASRPFPFSIMGAS